MFQQNNSSFISSASSSTYDSALRDYMATVYKHMSIALIVSGLVSFFLSQSPSLMQAIFGTPLKWLVIFAPLALVLFASFKFHSLTSSQIRTFLYVYAGAIGVSLSSIFLIYTAQSIVRIFFITSSTFGLMSLYGYTTKKDLTSFGSFLIMGVIGILIASLVNIFLKSSGLQLIISVIAVFIFIGLIAYDTQKIKENYFQFAHADAEQVNKIALWGALNLYMDFINLFVHLLHLFGDKRN
jgi:FtsH-binding integral membrane protein